MLLAVYSHYMVSDPFERSGPALVFTFMLGGRLVVWYQVSETRLKSAFFFLQIFNEHFCTFHYDAQTSRREAEIAAAAAALLAEQKQQ